MYSKKPKKTKSYSNILLASTADGFALKCCGLNALLQFISMITPEVDLALKRSGFCKMRLKSGLQCPKKARNFH